jgi:hypothetical protein
VTVSAFVHTDEGTDIPANVSRQFKVRYRNGKIQTYHEGNHLSGRRMLISIQYTR